MVPGSRGTRNLAREMVVRLGAVTGVGHARLILERFGNFWGAFSVIDLFILNALTIVTEFIGISLAAGYLGVPKIAAVALAAVVVVAAAFTGSFRAFERIAVAFCAGSLLPIPLYLMVHPAAGQMARDFVVPALPGGSGQLATVMLLIIGIVGTTVAPWQLFFQQSYVIDKRITPRFMRYEKTDLWIGIVIVIVGGAAIMGATTAAFAGTRGSRTSPTPPGWRLAWPPTPAGPRVPCSRSRCWTPRSSAPSRCRCRPRTRSVTSWA